MALATNEFIQIVQLNPTNELGALALFYIGECNVQLANYDAATNAYGQAFNTNTFAGRRLRAQRGANRLWHCAREKGGAGDGG